MKRSFKHLLASRVAVTTTAGMAACAIGTFLLLRWSLDRELNANILNVASIQAAALTDAATGEMHFHEWDLTPDEAASVRGLVRYAQVWSGAGASLLRSQYMTGDLPVGIDALRAAAAGEIVWEEATFEGSPIRSVLYPLARLGDVHSEHVLQIAAPLGERNAMLVRAALLAIVLVALAGFASALGGRWLADRSLRPVVEIIDEAEALEAGTLRRRITAHADTAEYERLVHVLNAMLDRIQSAFDAQRRFTADASHELRSPLTAMRGELELALRKERTGMEYREALASAREEVVRMGRIVEGLLTLARADAGAMEPRLERSDLGELARDAVERATGGAAMAGVALETVVPGPVPGIFDRDLVSQLAANLIANAVRFAGREGRVRVSVSSAKSDALLVVEDSGPGFSHGTESAAFERFWRADPSRTPDGAQGTGLGLAIAKAIAKAHGGEIVASGSAALGGARVEVRLPLGPIAPDPRFPAPLRPS